MAAQNLRRATVLLDEGAPSAAVLKRLRAVGFKVESSLKAIGAVTGTIPSEKAGKLHAVKGVKSVQFEQSFQLAPPDSPIQ
jgi:hypothetical protein